MTLFPLTLAPFEDYLRVDDSADHPMQFFFRMTFRGLLDRSAFEAAVDTARTRHPMLQAVVRQSGLTRFEWVAAARRPAIRWATGAGPSACQAASPIDLTSEIGLRFYVDQQGDHTSVLVQFHHMCCDGLGALEFLRDLWAAYRNVVCCRTAAASLRPLDRRRLAARGRFVGGPVRWLLRIPKELLALYGVYEYFAHRPVALPSPNGSAKDPAGEASPAGRFFGTCAYTFDKAETKRLRNAAKSLGCATNDLLLRDFFLVLHAWAAEHDPRNRSGCLRIMIPTSLRGFADRTMPATNRVSMVFLDRRPHGFSTPKALLESVRWEMDLIKRARLGLALLHGIRLVRRIPGGLRTMLPENRCLATALLTNLGNATSYFPFPHRREPVAAGETALESVEAFAPLRPQTHAAVAVLVYAGRLALGVSYNPRRLTDDDAQSLLGRYVDRLRRSAHEAC